MTCPSALTRALYADGALSPDDAAAFERHATDCADCQRRVAVLAGENRALRTAFDATEVPGEVPAFSLSPPTIAGLLGWLGWAITAGLAANLAWSSLAATELPSWIGWLAPDPVGAGIDLAIALTLRLISDGGDLLNDAIASLAWLALVGAVAAVWLLVRRNPARTTPLCLSLCLAAVLMGNAAPTFAFEVRRDEHRVTIPADETIDDTLIVMADSVLVEGTVTGDLIALGERVTLRGSVDGTVVAIGEELKIGGQVTDTVLGLGESVEFWRAALGANAYGAGRRVSLSADTRVAGSTALAAETVEVNGGIGRDLLAAARSVSLLGSVDRGFTAYADRADLGASAHVGGDLTARVRSTDDLTVSPEATVEGETTVTTQPEEPNRYFTVEFYVVEALKLAAAFVTGLVLFRLVPELRGARLDSGSDVLTAAGLGAVALVAVPVLAAVTILTLIGAPLGILALLAWLAALYAAGIVTAAFLGERLRRSTDREALTLLVGLAVVFVLINLPFAGGLLHLLVILLGLGLIAQWLRARWAARPA